MTRRIQANWAIVVGLGLILAMPDVASAQQGRRGFGRGFGLSKVDLAAMEQVQTELKMTDEQETKTAKISDQLRADRRELFQSRSGGGSDIRREMQKLSRKASAAVDEVLEETQRQRLQEIAIHVNGPAELANPAVAKTLALTEEQQSNLETAREENNQARRDAFAEFADLSQEERRESREEQRETFGKLTEAANDRLLAVLTDDQRAQFDEMKGEPFEFDWSQFRRGFGGRRGGGSGNN